MKDAYSFHLTEESLANTYQNMYQAYCTIFTRLGLEFRAVLADSGAIGGKVSQEIHVIADSGEDTLLYSDTGLYAANVEVAKNLQSGDASPDGQGILKQAKGIEVGHIFQLGKKYSDAMNLSVLDPEGKSTTLYMGCYGIGVSRIVAASIEQNNDANGIIWPEAIAPFKVAIVPVGIDKSVAVKQAADNLYAELKTAGIDALYCDKPERPGIMFKDLDLIGIPHRIVISEKTLAENKFEYKSRIKQNTGLLSKEEMLKIIV
jgi:prolyl-tRNA synthetase